MALQLTDSEILEVHNAVKTGVADIDSKLTDDIITSSLVVGAATDWAIHAATDALNLSGYTAERQRAFANAYTDETNFINVALTAGQRGVFRRAVLFKTASNCVLYLRNLTSESGGAVSQSWETPEFTEKQNWLDAQADSQIEVLRSLYPEGVDCTDDITFAGILGTLGSQRTGGTIGGGSTPTPTPSVDFDITGLTAGTPTATDEFAFYDTSESGLRKANIQAILDLADSQSFSISGLTSATPQVADEIPFNDISDSNSNKKATITNILSVWATANAAQLVPTTGTTGHYLKKTATGSEWAEVSGGGGGSFDIEDLTTATPATGDYLAFHDSSGNADRKATIQTVLNLASQASFSIDGLTAVTPALTDYIPIADVSDSDANKKALLSSVLGLIDESDWRVSGLTSATPTTSDMLAFSDESETGDPNRKATIATVLGLADDWKVSDLTTATPRTTDFLAFSDESATGDPNRKATISTILALASQASFDIDALTAESTPATADTIAVYDTSANAMRKVTLANIQSLIGSTFNINILTAETSPATGDAVAIYDASASAMRKVTLANIKTLIETGAPRYVYNGTSFNLNSLNTQPFDITYDSGNDEYLVGNSSGSFSYTVRLYRYSKDGTYRGTRTSTDRTGLSALTYNPNTSSLYWGGPPNNIKKGTLTGSVESTYTANANNTHNTAMAFDTKRNLLLVLDVDPTGTDYWYEYNENGVYQNRRTVNSANANPQGIAYDPTNDEILITDDTDGAYHRYAPSGTYFGKESISDAITGSADVWICHNSDDNTLAILKRASGTDTVYIFQYEGAAGFNISELTAATPTLTDYVALSDTSDSNTNKKALVSSLLSLSDFDIHGLTTATPSTSDFIPFSDESISGDPNRKASIETILGLVDSFDINGLTALTSPATADTIAVYDTSASAMRKVTLANIQSLIGGGGGGGSAWTNAATAPSNPTDGQGWYDTTNNILKIYDGTTWPPASGFDHYNNPTAAAALGDWIGFADISDSNKPKKDTIQDILNLGGFATQKSLFSENKFWAINQNNNVGAVGEWVFLNASNAVVSTNNRALTSTEVSSIRFIEIHEDVFGNSDYLNAIANEDNSTGFTQLQTNGGVLYIHDTDASNYGTIAGDYFTVTITAAGSSKTGSVYKFACTVTQTGSVWNGGQWYAFDFDVVSTQKLQAQQLVDVQTLFAHTLAVQNTDRLLAMNGAALGSIDTGTLLSRYVEIGDLIGDDTADFYTQFQPVAALLNALTTNKRGAWALATNASGAPTQTDNINYTQINDGNYTLVIAAIQQNSDWTFKSTAYTASDFSDGDILYAHPYDPYNAKDYYKMTLTGNSTLVGTGNAAYLYAPVTVDEVGSVTDPSDGWRITEKPPTDILSGLRGRLPIASTPELNQSSKLLLSTFNEATIAHLGKHIRPDTTAPTIVPTTFETTNANIKNGNNLVGIQNPLLNGVMALLWSIPNSVNDSGGNAVAVADIEDRLNIHHQFELYSGSKVIKGTVTNFNKVVLPGATYHQVNLQDATQAGSAFTDGESVNIEIKSGIVGRDEFSPIAFGNVLALASATPLATDSLAFYDASNGGLRRATISTILALASGGSFSVSDTTTGTPATTDYLVFSDESVANDPNRKATIQTVLDLASASGLDIDGLTAETAPTFADALAIYDASASANRKVTLTDFVVAITKDEWVRNTGKDISQSVLRSANSSISPNGITYDGSSVLVADSNADAVWGFTNGARDTSKDISQSVLRSANSSISPNGITYDGSSVLVLDFQNDAVWGFTNGARDTSKDISQSVLRSADNSINPTGIAWDGSSVLVLDRNADAVWGFTNGARDTSKDISQSVLRSANSSITPYGITYDGSSVLVADSNADAVWGFTNGARDTSKDIPQSVLQSVNNNINLNGMTYDGSSVLVADSNADAVWGFINLATFFKSL